MDIYNLINSKSIGEHCRKINHKFNTEELAVLIYRNKRMSIDEKIKAYQELINDYPDMEVIERINCKHYDSVKDMIKQEIARINKLITIFKSYDQDTIYTFNFSWLNDDYKIIEGHREYRNLYKTFEEVEKLLYEEIKDDEDNRIVNFSILKKTVSKKEKYEIKAEYIVDENRSLKMVNICDLKGGYPDISNICLNIPTPFKKRRFISCKFSNSFFGM